MAKQTRTVRDYSIHGKSASTGNLAPTKYNPAPIVAELSNSPRAKRRRAKKGKA